MNEIEKVIEAIENRYFKDIQNKAPVENIRFNEIIFYALKEKLERENPKPMTNYERIKNMSVDEMANYFSKYLHCDDCPVDDLCKKINDNESLVVVSCEQRFKQWLESEVEE